MPADRTFLWLALACYAVSCGLTIRRLRAGGASALLHRINLGLMLAGFVLHMVFMTLRGQAVRSCPLTNTFEVLTFIAWAAVLFYLLIGTAYRISFLGAFTAPLTLGICLAALLAAADVHHPRPTTHSGWVDFHAAIGALASGSFGLAAVAGLMYLIQQRQLKSRRLMPVFMELPSLEQLDTINLRLTLMGFALLTASMVGGVISHKILGKTPLPKVIWAWAVWFIYALVLGARPGWDWRGRKAAQLAIVAFAFVLATYWAMNWLQEFYRVTP